MDILLPDEQIILDLVLKLKILLAWLLRYYDMWLPDEQIILDLVLKLKILLAWLQNGYITT